MSTGESYRAGNLDRVFERSSVLAGESDHDVGSNREIGQERIGSVAEAEIEPLIVRPVHRLQNAAIPALQRDVEMIAQPRLIRECTEQRIGNLRWLNGRQADAL